MTLYSIQNYISDIRLITKEETIEKNIIDRIKPLSKKLVKNKSWIKSEYFDVDTKQGFGLHLLHEEIDHSLAVFVIAWAPDKGFKEGYADLIKTHEETLYPGDASCCLPEDIHSVWNNGNETALSLHTYGMHLNHTGRSIFDISQKTETPCIVKVQG